MASFSYTGFNDGGSSVQIYYSVSYDSINNQTTVTFEPSWFKAFGNSEIQTIWDTSITITATDSGDTQKSSIYFTQGVYSGRQFFNPTPTPSQVIVQHSSTAGKKSVQISSFTYKNAKIYSGSAGGEVTVESGEYIYGKVHEPTNCFLAYESAKPNSNEIYRDTILNLSWTAAIDGDHNPVNGYRLYYGLSGEGYTQSLDIGNIQNYSFKIMNNFGGPTKGTTFQLGIQAKATYGELHSDIISLGDLTIINKPPEQPKVRAEGIIRITGNVNTDINIIINTENKTDIDVDEDEVTYFYVVSDELNFREGDEKELPSNRIISMNPNQPYLFIRAKETSALQNPAPVSGNWVRVPVTVNEIPSIEISYQISQEATAKKDSSIRYANKIGNITCRLGKTPGTTKLTNSFRWDIGNSFNYKTFITQGSGGSTPQGSLSNISVSSATANSGGGQLIKIRVIITDGAGDSFVKEIVTDYYRLYKVAPKSLKILPVEETSAAVDEKYINNLINAVVEADFPTNDVSRFVKFQLGKENDQGEWIYTDISSQIMASMEQQSTYGAFTTNVQLGEDKKYRFKVILSDEFGNNVQYIDESKSYQRLPLFNVNDLSFNRMEWHPLKDYIDGSNLELIFTTLYQDSIGNIGKNSYTIQAEYNGQIYNLANRLEHENSQDWETVISGSTIEFKISNIELFKKLKTATNVPQISVIYKITGYNAFGVPGVSKTINGVVITQEAPSVANISINAKVKSDSQEDFKTWFNPEDEVELLLTNKPFDYNDLLITENGEFKEQKTITNYILLYKYSELEEWRKPQSSWQGWQGSFIENNEYLTSIVLKSMPSLSLNGQETKIILGLQLIDDTNLVPLQLNSNLPQILTIELKACRKEKIVFSIDSAKLTEKKLDVALSINDFGGNSKGFENFTRSGAESFKIILEVGFDDTTFFTYEANIPYDGEESGKQVLNRFLNKMLIPFAELVNGEEESSKLYIKATLEIITNSSSDNKISATTATYLLYLSQPTMSHRAHWVGINTSDLALDEVFKVSEYKEQRFIKLVGNYQGYDENGQQTSPQPVEISIDLKEGIISSKIDDIEGYKINMRTGQVKVGNISANDVNVDDIFASNISGARITGGTW